MGIKPLIQLNTYIPQVIKHDLKDVSYIRLVGLALIVVSAIQLILSFFNLIEGYIIIPVLATCLVYTRLNYSKKISKKEWRYRLLWTSIGFAEISITIAYNFFNISTPIFEILVISGLFAINAYRYINVYHDANDMDKFNSSL